MKKPDIALIIASKMKKGKGMGMEKEGEDKYVEMAKELIDAIEKKDAKLVAETLNHIHECWDAEHEDKDMEEEKDMEEGEEEEEE